SGPPQRIGSSVGAPPGPSRRVSATGNETAAASISERHEPTTVIPASRRVQVHVHDVDVDPASYYGRRKHGGIRGVRVVADGAGLRPRGLCGRDALSLLAARQTTAGGLHVFVRLPLLQRHPPPGLGYRPRTGACP